MSLKIKIFDPQDETLIVESRRLPHWSQAGTIGFITFRTIDSMPKSVVERWHEERRKWLQQHGIELSSIDGGGGPERLGPKLQRKFEREFSNRWNNELDRCHGACALRYPELAKIVADSLKHFDGQRYDLTDFVVMPNHVHVLAAFNDADQMLKQCDSWKHFTATQINRRLKTTGRFWQQDAFDHLVRSDDEFQRLRKYIADNPTRAGLRPGEYIHESKT